MLKWKKIFLLELKYILYLHQTIKNIKNEKDFTFINDGTC